jgi:hypothetical protein
MHRLWDERDLRQIYRFAGQPQDSCYELCLKVLVEKSEIQRHAYFLGELKQRPVDLHEAAQDFTDGPLGTEFREAWGYAREKVTLESLLKFNDPEELHNYLFTQEYHRKQA